MILERIDKSGHVIECHAFNTDSVTLGRGYDNDLIINDPYVDARHVRLDYDIERKRFVLIDLGSENGVRLEDNVSPPLQPGETATLESGAIVVLGKTRYRILRSNHAVPPALRLSYWDPAYAMLGTWRAFTVIIALALGLEALVLYWKQPYTDQLHQDLIPSLYLVFLAFGYGLAWVMVARVQRHEGRLLMHANLVLLALVGVNLYLLIEPVLAFNLDWLLLGGQLSTLLACLGLFLMMYVSCYQSTGLTRAKRLGVSLALPGIVILGVMVAEVNQPEFQSRPSYNMTPVSPFWQYHNGVDQEEFMAATQSAYQAPSKAALERR